jgi:hypothetical protein
LGHWIKWWKMNWPHRNRRITFMTKQVMANRLMLIIWEFILNLKSGFIKIIYIAWWCVEKMKNMKHIKNWSKVWNDVRNIFVGFFYLLCKWICISRNQRDCQVGWPSVQVRYFSTSELRTISYHPRIVLFVSENFINIIVN